VSEIDTLAAAEADAATAKTVYRAHPTPANRETHRAASTALREARWRARGGLDNPYGATTYADFAVAERAARRAEGTDNAGKGDQ
jgi:hypothetical protein